MEPEESDAIPESEIPSKLKGQHFMETHASSQYPSETLEITIQDPQKHHQDPLVHQDHQEQHQEHQEHHQDHQEHQEHHQDHHEHHQDHQEHQEHDQDHSAQHEDHQDHDHDHHGGDQGSALVLETAGDSNVGLLGTSLDQAKELSDLTLASNKIGWQV